VRGEKNNSEKTQTSCNLDSAGPEIAAPNELQRLQSYRRRITVQKEPADEEIGLEGRTFFSKYKTPDRLSVLLSSTSISCISRNHLNKHSSSLKGEKYASEHQANLRSVSAG
jgi:hypothetical protein